MEIWEQTLKTMDAILDARLPHAIRADDDLPLEDEPCALRVEYRDDSTRDETIATVVRIFGSFGGNEFQVPMSAFSESRLQDIEACCAEEIRAADKGREEISKFGGEL